MSAPDQLDLSPHPSALLESLRSIGYTLETALADIIDNSITAKSALVSVRFLWNGGVPWVAIVDDGHGMTREELIEAMRFGSRTPIEARDENDLGRFGLGMKTASISQCRHLTVVSKRKGTLTACEWDLDKIAANGSATWLAGLIDPATISGDELLGSLVEEALAKRTSGTVLLWRRLDNSNVEKGNSVAETRFSEEMDSARKHLEMVFHRFLSPDLGKSAIRMDFNGNALEAFNPFGPLIPARQELPSETVRIEGRKMQVQPYILPHQSKVSKALYEQYAGEQGYVQNQGFYIYRNRRLIVKATWFRLIKKEELNKLIRVRVDIPNSLDHLWKIDVKKSQATPPEAVRRELKKIIGRISGAGKEVFNRRATRLKNRSLNPVWCREVSDGRIRYCVNEEHPLLKSLLEQGTKEQAGQLRVCLRLINETFPHELFFADAASDTTEFEKPTHGVEEIRAAAIQLIDALRMCGYEGEDLRKQVYKTEAFPFSPELIEELLLEKFDPND
ncbi:MAG: ATP-binding protein [Luteolibacter sp.]